MRGEDERSMKSFGPTDGSNEPPADGGGRNQETDFHGQRRSNETHTSTTDPEARLYRKGPGKEAKLCFMGHALMENRNGLIVDACLTPADGHAERVAALHMIEPCADRPHATSPAIGAHFDRVAAFIVGTVDQDATNARGAHLSKGDFLLAGGLGHGP